jgi:hypothetical protein
MSHLDFGLRQEKGCKQNDLIFAKDGELKVMNTAMKDKELWLVWCFVNLCRFVGV